MKWWDADLIGYAITSIDTGEGLAQLRLGDRWVTIDLWDDEIVAGNTQKGTA